MSLLRPDSFQAHMYLAYSLASIEHCTLQASVFGRPPFVSSAEQEIPECFGTHLICMVAAK